MKKKNLQNTQSTTSLAKKNQKNSQTYRNPMLWARKNLTILLHNNIQGEKKLQNTQSTTSLAKKIPKNSQPYRNPMLWARKNLTILLHNNIHYFSKSDSIELIWPIKISFPGNIQQNFTECHQNQQVPPGIITNIPTDNKNQNMLVGKGLILK